MAQPFRDYPFTPTWDPEYRTRCGDTLDLALNLAPAYRAWRTLDPGVNRAWVWEILPNAYTMLVFGAACWLVVTQRHRLVMVMVQHVA